MHQSSSTMPGVVSITVAPTNTTTRDHYIEGEGHRTRPSSVASLKLPLGTSREYVRSISSLKERRKSTLLQKLLSLRFLLLASFTLLVLMMGLINFFISSSSLDKTSSELSDKILDNIIVRVGADVEDLFGGPYSSVQELTRHVDGSDLSTEFLRSELWKVWNNGGQPFDSLSIVNATTGNTVGYFANYKTPSITGLLYNNMTSGIATLAIVDDYELGLANLSDPHTLYVPAADVRLAGWWGEAIAAKKQIWSAPYRFPSIAEDLYFTTVFPLFDKTTGVLTAGFFATYTSGKVNLLLTSISISKNSKIWLMGPNGDMVATSDLDESMYLPGNANISIAQNSNVELIRETTRRFFAMDTSNSSHFSYSLHKKDIEAYVQRIAAYDLGLYLLIAYPKSDFLQEVAVVRKNITVVTVVVLVVSVAIGVWVMFLVTAPLSRLGKQMDDISVGDFENRNLNESARKSSILYEIHSLQLDFQRMVNAVRSFGKYVPVDIVKHLLQSDEVAEAQVSQKDLTIMFSDIKGFTNKVEEMTPQQLSTILTDYLNSMCAVITNNKGTIDKFIGDAIMALWNVPSPVSRHVACACDTALQSIHALRDLNKKWRMNGLPDIECRIGIHTGRALVGNLGSKERLSYTAVGDNVNLASRLEALNKRYDTSILISGEAYKAVNKEFLCRFLDIVVVQGRTTPTRVYELIARLEDASQEQIHLCAKQADAVDLFYNRHFKEALVAFKALHMLLPHDQSIKYFIERATEADAISALPADWTGYSVLLEK